MKMQDIIEDTIDHHSMGNVPPDVIAAFGAMAQIQRGAPEQRMRYYAEFSGAISSIMEHTGDIVWRMVEHFSRDGTMDVGEVGNKITSSLSALNPNNVKYSMGQMKRNFIDDMKGKGLSDDELRSSYGELTSKADNALDAYAAAYSELPAYNHAQDLAIKANIALGRRDWETAREAVSMLDDMHKNNTLETIGSSVTRDADGNILRIN